MIALLGIGAIIGAAVLLSSNRRAINIRIVLAAFSLQVVLAVITLKFEWGKEAIAAVSRVALAIIGYSSAGIDMVFGPLASDEIGFSFAVRVLPIVVFFSALMSVLYHLNIMPWVVKIVGGILRRIIGTSNAESLNAAANIFIGGTEAPLVVRPHLKTLHEEQLFAVMVSGLASVSGTVLAAYVLMGADIRFLLSATVMSAPGGLLMAKLMMPDRLRSASEQEDKPPIVERSRQANVIMAAAVGTMDGIKLAVYIGAMLISFVALIALFNGTIGWLGEMVGVEVLSLQKLLGWLFSPIMFLVGVPWAEVQGAGALFGEKLVLNEFVAFGHLKDYLVGASARTVAIVTFSLCGFANFAAIAIVLGGLGSLVPEKRELIATFGVKAVIAGSFSNLMSAALAGLLLSA